MYILRDVKPFSASAPRVIATVCETAAKPAALAARRAAKTADMIELRADFLNLECDVAKTLGDIRGVIGETPLIFTFRSADEGGACDIDEETRLFILEAAAKTAHVDFIDIELSAGESAIRRVCGHGARVIISYHDFCETPTREALLGIFRAQLEAGANCAKIAVTPKNPGDVLALLGAAETFHRESTIPFIAISMGQMGMISRVFGHVFGSAATFGHAGKAAAPGQIEAARLKLLIKETRF